MQDKHKGCAIEAVKTTAAPSSNCRFMFHNLLLRNPIYKTLDI